jgi:dTDP-4-dehydrorhamnose reductase
VTAALTPTVISPNVCAIDQAFAEMKRTFHAWVTGAGGLIGNYLVKTAPPHWNALGLTRADLDITSLDDVSKVFLRTVPLAIIHCAAISKNPVCDANPAEAQWTNVKGTQVLAELANDFDIPFVFLSTDLVFDGTKGNYNEEDELNPLSVYAATKVEAENIVEKECPREGTIIRTSLNAGHSPTGDRAFNEEMRKAFAEGKTLNLFEDEFRCPIPAEVTARAIWEIVGQPGIFHLCGTERLSRYQIGELIAENRRDLNPKIVRGTLRDYKGSPRSPDTSMDCSKIQAKLSFALPKFSDWARQQPSGTL